MSATDTEAPRVPVAEGVKVTVMVQLFFGPSDVPQVLVWAKSVEFVPVIVMPVMVRVLLPLTSVMVMFCAALVVPTV